MQYGARNVVNATVRSVRKGDVMSLVKFDLIDAPEVASSVLTSESVEDMDLKIGDKVQLVVKAIHVLPVKQ
jgi:molybdopterin-binding protein